MSSITLPDGVWPVMITPFKPDKTIDFEAYKNLINFYLSKGISGLFACCGSSEFENLTKDEMLEIISIAVETTANRVPVVAGAILFTDLSEQIDFINEVYNKGAKAVIIATNQFVKKDEVPSNWLNRLNKIIDNTSNIPLGTYELPVPWHYVISADEFKWMVGTKRFVFHKDTSCNLISLKQKIDAAKGSDLKVFSAHSPSILESLKIGVNGYCGTGANFMPELYVWLCKNFKKRPALAKNVQEFLTKLEHRVDECQNYPANAKAFMNLRNVKMNHICRSIDSNMSLEHIQKLASVLDDSQKTCKLITVPKNKKTSVAKTSANLQWS